MIFVDTSAIFAVADRSDHNHARALRSFRHLLDDGVELLTHSYVLVEAAALLQHRLGLDTALLFLRESQAFRLHWVSSRDHAEAVKLLGSAARRRLSLVDCASFVVMRRYDVREALAFDSDFEREGFSIYPAPEHEDRRRSPAPG